MSELIIDARGMLCPKPLILAKDAIGKLKVGEQMTILIDNQTAKENVCQLLQDHGAETTCREEEGIFTIHVKRNLEDVVSAASGVAPSYSTAVPKPHTIVFTKRTMGFGSEELGEILIKAFINTIGEASPLPGTMIFYNDGIHLAIEGSPVLDALRALETRGVKILVCGTCLDYYGKKHLLQIGLASNMYDILQELTDAGHVIMP